jgi:uncharacterized UPF0160 family protein
MLTFKPMNFLRKLFGKSILLVTHSGTFHPDEVFACATITLWAEKHNIKIRIMRSREQGEIGRADIVVDVGGQYNPETKRFDHHQIDKNLTRDNGVDFASFGLVWKSFGMELCSSKKIFDIVDRELVVPIDLEDNGIQMSQNNKGYREYGINRAIINFNSTYLEENTEDKSFNQALLFAKEIIVRELAVLEAREYGFIKTNEQIEKQKNSEILVLEDKFYWEESVAKEGNIKFVVYPGKKRDEWCAQSARDNPSNYQSVRALFPKEWMGLKDAQLVGVSGIDGLVFCHKGRHFLVGNSRGSVLSAINIALQNGGI